MNHPPPPNAKFSQAVSLNTAIKSSLFRPDSASSYSAGHLSNHSGGLGLADGEGD